MGGRRPNQGDNGGGLILGGNGGVGGGRAPGSTPPKIIVPGGGSAPRGQPQGGRAPPAGDDADIQGGVVLSGIPSAGKFRPPQGFMSMDGPRVDEAVASADPEELLRKLRSRAGMWHQLAKYLPALYSKGFNSSVVDEQTGLTPVEQNCWIVAATIYDSLADSGAVEPAILAAFDDGGDGLLYPFRLLSVDKRARAAEYILAQRLQEGECEVLARAMKEWDRRPSERQGFSNGPADCLAFKYLRDASEVRTPEEREAKLKQALATAETESARARLQGMLQADVEETGTSSEALLNILRMSHEELGFRPLPVVTALGTASAADVAAAPRSSQTGAFGAFAVHGPGQWVALPQWKALEMARRPVALPIAECADEAAVMTASRAKTKEEKKRMAGPGMLVVEADMQLPEPGAEGPPMEGRFFLVEAQAGGMLQLMGGDQAVAQGLQPVAEVLFLARPPRLEMLTSPEVLQL